MQEGGVLQLCLYEIMNHIEEADTSGHRSSGRKRPAELMFIMVRAAHHMQGSSSGRRQDMGPYLRAASNTHLARLSSWSTGNPKDSGALAKSVLSVAM
ncbi:hypothetical protein DN613_21195 [Aeromonas caviae]|nr:hypothetical protein DN613_21195 [Aeromonas caviae]